jgi:hypothetical protein
MLVCDDQRNGAVRRAGTLVRTGIAAISAEAEAVGAELGGQP